MTARLQALQDALAKHLPAKQVLSVDCSHHQLTLEVAPEHLLSICEKLRDTPALDFTMLVDVAGVDYLHYGMGEWQTKQATATGFDRGVESNSEKKITVDDGLRFAVVYHLLSINKNQRLRLRVRLDNNEPRIASVINIWNSANWFEREAFDLFGIIFDGHPDLRRILTDYGFIGHPFRKDFPLSGHVEVRYDATQKRVVYEPVDIVPRVLVPKIIRDDSHDKL